METIRFLFVLAAQKGWSLFHSDVKSTFLNGEIIIEVYMEQPMGFEVEGKEHMVHKLKKALYGLKQAPRAWYTKIDSYFSKQGFRRSENEHILYRRSEKDGNVLLMCIYVDDIVCSSSSLDLIVEFKSEMEKHFNMTNLGLLSYFLGIEVVQDEQGVFVSHSKYAHDLLKKFNMLKCKLAPMPMFTNGKLQAKDGPRDTEAHRYRSLVG